MIGPNLTFVSGIKCSLSCLILELKFSNFQVCIKMKHIIFSIICFSFVLFAGGLKELAENSSSLDLLKNEIDDFRRLENLKVNWPKIKN